MIQHWSNTGQAHWSGTLVRISSFLCPAHHIPRAGGPAPSPSVSLCHYLSLSLSQTHTPRPLSLSHTGGVRGGEGRRRRQGERWCCTGSRYNPVQTGLTSVDARSKSTLKGYLACTLGRHSVCNGSDLKGSGFRSLGLGFGWRGAHVRFGVQGFGFRVQGFGFRI